jgi:ectoine hydroxylase-related dioxygenase (phytanoyl-CoA dioxygenase family)
MEISEALYALGVRDDTLSSHEREQLDLLGYLPIPGIMSAELVAELRARQAELLAEEGDRAGTEVHQEKGTDRLSDLINKGQIYHIVITQPRVLAAIAHVLDGDLKLSSLNSRNALPGQGLQGLHADWGRLDTPGKYQVCNSLWLLDDFLPNNGATRVVPGTHRGTASPGDEMADPTASHPNELLLQGKAGDVLVMNSHTWHGGTINQTDKPRRVLHGYFCRRNQPQQLDQQKYIRQQTLDQLSTAAHTVLGVRG